jgi:hypothetical protein
MSVVELSQVKKLRRVALVLEKAGWKCGRTPNAGSAPDGPSIYLLDVATGRQFLMVTRTGSIESDSDRLRKEGFVHTDAVDGVVGIMEELVTGKAPFNDEFRAALYIAAEAYVAGTSSFAMARAQGFLENCSFVILRYEDYANKCKLLRPIIVPYARVLSPEKVQLAAEQALAIDRQSHPERFERAKVLPIRVSPPETV